MATNTCFYPGRHHLSIISAGLLLICGKNVLILSLYDIICVVEPVDAWKPEGNPYESGEVLLFSSSTIITLPVILICDCKCKPNRGYPRKRIWVSAPPVIEGTWSQMARSLQDKIISCFILFLPKQNWPTSQISGQLQNPMFNGNFI